MISAQAPVVPESRPRKDKPTSRSFLIGIAAVAMLSALTPYNDDYVGATRLAGNFFPVAATGLLLVLVLIVNPTLSLLNRRRSMLSKAELVTIWAMVAVSSGIPSSGVMRYLMPQIVAPHYFANTGNNWNQLLAHIPDRLLVSDRAAVQAYYEGLPYGHRIPWSAWLVPMGNWSLFIALLFGAFFCLTALLRRQWTEYERLSFPLVRVPIMMADAPHVGQSFNELFRSKALWIAVAAVTALHTVKGMHCLWPTIPDINVTYSTQGAFADPPLNRLSVALSLYPLVIGLGFMVPLEVSYSIWFFFIAFQVQTIGGHFLGFDETPPGQSISMGPAYVSYQEAGGALALVGWLTWSMREHLRDVFWKAIGKARDVDDTNEPMSYRAALLGLGGALIGMYLWLTVIATVTPLMATVVVLGAVVVSVVTSWFVAQAGMIFVQQTFSPAELLAVMGNAHISPASCTMAAMAEHAGGWYDVREEAMPSLVNAMKITDDVALSAKSFVRALAAAVAVAFVVSAIVFIWLPYTHGGALKMEYWTFSLAPQIPFIWGYSQVNQHHGSAGGAIANLIGGGLFVLSLFGTRQLIPGFGLHPAGFIVAGSYATHMIWFSLFLSWLFKSLIMRYGGAATYKRCLPFFVGLIVGDCINSLLWAAIGLFTHVGYSLLPG
jgi:hypothetical protein